MNIKIDSADYLPLENTLNMYNVVIRIKPFSNKNHNHSFYQVFLEKWFYKQYFNALL